MSVQLYEYKEFVGVYNELLKIPKLENVIKNNTYIKNYYFSNIDGKNPLPPMLRFNFDNVLGRLLWYMYVANRVAYSLQYQENEDIFTPKETPENYNLEEARRKFGSFMYNIYTNNGTVFLSKDWLGLAKDIQYFLKNNKLEQGGELILGGATTLRDNGDIMQLGIANSDAVFKHGGAIHEMRKEKDVDIYEEQMAKGGEIDAFTMSMIKGNGDITELETKDAKIKMAKGGKIGFDGLAKKVAKSYVGKKVPKKFQNQYGKTYSPAEAKEVGDKVAGAVYRMQQAKKMAKGGMITSAPEYLQVRNAEYDRRVKSGKMKDTDDNFERFDEMYFDELVEKGRIDPDNYFAKGGVLSKAKVGDKVKLIKGSGSDTIFRNFPNGVYEVKKVKKGSKSVPEGFYEIENKDGNKTQLATSRFETKMAKGGEIEYDNDENEAVGNFLLNTKDGQEILKKSKNSSQLEKEVVKYHTKKGIPNWEFEDDDDEGIDWVTFGDLYNSVKDHYAKGGVMKTYDDFGKDYDAFTDYVMDRISLEERRKIRKQWNESKSKMQWQDYLLKEVNKKSMAKGGKTQGYNDKLNESLGDTKGKRSTKEQNYKDRRNESEAMEKKEGKRKYSRVKTMDKGSRKLKKPNSFFAVVKRKQKKGEAWKDAIQRVKNEMKK